MSKHVQMCSQRSSLELGMDFIWKSLLSFSLKIPTIFFLCLLQRACYRRCFKVRVGQENHLRMSPSFPANQSHVYPEPHALPLSHLCLLCIPVRLTEPGLHKRNWGQDVVRRIFLLLPLPLRRELERAQLDFHMPEVEFAESRANLLWKCRSLSRGELWFNLVKWLVPTVLTSSGQCLKPASPCSSCCH